MSGTRQTQFTVSGQSTDWKDPDAARVYIERIVEPVFKRVRNTVNQLARDWLHVTASQVVDAKYGLVLVDATAGAVTLTIPSPEDSFHPLVVVKTDASGNSVTVQARGGSLISGSATDIISGQWGVSMYEGDEDKYLAVIAGNLGGDVTGPIRGNTVVKLQNRALASTAPLSYQLIRSLDGATWAPAYEGYPEVVSSVTFSLGAGSVDAVAFTVPASPSGSGRFVLQRVYVRLTTALGGADTGTVAVRVGSTVGGNEFATDQTINNATAAGTIISGLSVATRGASILVANAYEASLAAGATVNIRATTTGTVTAGSATAYVYGAFLP